MASLPVQANEFVYCKFPGCKTLRAVPLYGPPWDFCGAQHKEDFKKNCANPSCYMKASKFAYCNYQCFLNATGSISGTSSSVSGTSGTSDP